VVGIFKTRSFIRSDGAKNNGTGRNKTGKAKNVGPKLKLREPRTKIINLLYCARPFPACKSARCRPPDHYRYTSGGQCVVEALLRRGSARQFPSSDDFGLPTSS
jgi:hypothetical protein